MSTTFFRSPRVPLHARARSTPDFSLLCHARARSTPDLSLLCHTRARSTPGDLSLLCHAKDCTLTQSSYTILCV